ncbi:flippase [Vibrio harveyi]|nr:flippase [Vibrio harveyi]HDZ3729785.1 flippase [Vibrio harveyi]
MKNRAINILWMLSDKFAKVGLSFLVSIYVIKYFTPKEYGEIAYYQSIIFILVAFVSFGLENIILREISRGKEEIDKIIVNAIFLRLSVSVLVFLISLILMMSGFMSESFILFVILTCSLFANGFSAVELYNVAIEKGKRISLTSTVIAICFSVIKLVLIYYGILDQILFCVVFVFELIIYFLILSVMFLVDGRRFDLSLVSLKYIKWMLKESIPLLVANVVFGLYVKIDSLMISHMNGMEYVGYYSAGLKFSEVLFIIPMVVCNALFPYFDSLYKESKIEYNKILSIIGSVGFYSLLIVSVTLYFLGGYIIVSIIGEKYAISSQVFSIHVLSLPIVFIGVLSSKMLVIEGMQSLSMYRNFFGLIINVILNSILISTHGIVGAALASLISYFCAYVFFDFLSPSLSTHFKLKMSMFLFRWSSYVK